MRLKNVVFAAALIGSFMVLSPDAAVAQHRGGGRTVSRPPATHGQVGRSGGGGGVYWAAPYYGSIGWGYGGGYGWGYPRLWYPFGYGPYWYGPYWYGSYGYRGDYEPGGSVKFDVKPKQTEVFVDGYFAGTASEFGGMFDSLDIAPGNHSITLWYQGYRSVTQQIHLQVGRQLKLQYQMERLASGESQDPRPMPPPEAQAPPARGDVYVQQPDQPGSVNRPARPRRPMPPPPPPVEPTQPAPPAAQAPVGDSTEYSQLTIRVQPVGAQVFIDGEPWQTSQGADRLVVHLSAGVHHVEVRKDGFRTFKTDVQIRSGESTTLNVSLSGQAGQ